MSLTFYSAWYCPFAQRAWMALLHKGLAFDYVEVDPYRESRWWLEISRQRAQVPVIVAADDETGEARTVIDSTRVLEYVDELAADGHPLYPGSANDRAELRFWVDHINERIVPYVYRFLEADQPGDYREESRAALLDGTRALAEALSTKGPYFSGPDLTAVDLALLPFAYRIDALLGHYRDFAVPTDGPAWSRYQRWYDTMRSTTLFTGTLTQADGYRERLIAHYEPYTRGEGQQDVTEVP